MRRLVAPVAALLLAVVPGRAWAAGACPDGDWFCDPAPIPEQPAADPPGEAPPDAPTRPPESDRGEPKPSMRFDVPNVQPVKQRRPKRYREWGVNLHAALGLLGSDVAISPDASMNGLGAALRFRPIPQIAIEGSVDLLWGTDYNGYDRFENALLVSCMFFLNPRSAVQVYGLAGVGAGGAFIESSYPAGSDAAPRDESYRYVGGHLGFGLEARITRHFVLGGDLLGFLRERNDRGADARPEFEDPVTHRTTNTSGGGLVRLGVTFYW